MNMAAILWKFKLFDVALIWLQIRNLRPRISGIGLFWSLFIRFLTPIYYLPKFRRNLQVCSFNGLSVCLFVCVLHGTGRSFWPISTKLGPHMESGPTQVPILFIGQRSNNIQCPAAKSCLVQRAYWRKKNRAWRAPLPLNNILFYKSREGLEFWSKPSTVLWFMPKNMH